MDSNIIKTENLSFAYSGSKLDVQNLNLQVPSGSIYGFLGPNGSGKSTTIRLLLGLLKRRTGSIKLMGEFLESNRIACLRSVGALIEQPSLYEHLTAIENLTITANYLKNIEKRRIEEVLKTVQLDSAREKKVTAFSLGMKQRLGIAMCLLSNPKLLILDEPTNGLDPSGIIEIRNLIRQLNQEQGTTIFISSHLLSEIEKTCSHVGIIRNGEMLFQGSVKSFKDSYEENLLIEIEAANPAQILNDKTLSHYNFKEVEGNFLTTTVSNRSEILILIDCLRKNDVDLFQLKIKNDIEELFLSLTK